jgi:hypothetical protein
MGGVACAVLGWLRRERRRTRCCDADSNGLLAGDQPAADGDSKTGRNTVFLSDHRPVDSNRYADSRADDPTNGNLDCSSDGHSHPKRQPHADRQRHADGDGNGHAFTAADTLRHSHLRPGHLLRSHGECERTSLRTRSNPTDL